MSERPIDKVLGALHGVKQTGANTWRAKCPAHDDRTPSMKVTRADDEVVLCNCYVGCEFEDIAKAAGLKKSDFFPEKGRVYSNGSYKENLGAVMARGPRIIAEYYEYTNASGECLYRVLRYIPKGFSQQRPNGKGGWINDIEGIERVPYHLDEITRAGSEWVFLPEGERDTDNCRVRGLFATTFMGGAGRKPTASELEPFRGKRVALLCDNDGPGRERGSALLGALAGIAKEVRLVDLPGLPEKGDISDWFDLGHDEKELLALANAPVPPEALVPEAVVVNASDVTPENINWIWPGRLAAGKITLLEGDPGLGKSTLTIEIAARMSRGDPLPDGVRQKPMGVLFLSAEDGIADTIVPRLIAANADLSRIHFLEGIHGKDGIEGITIPNDLGLVERAMKAWGIGLIIIDPLSAYFADNVSENRNQEVRKALAPLKSMLERTGAASICLRHLTKAQSATPIYRGAGSIGLGGAARIVLMVGEDPDVPEIRVLAGVKENLSVKPQSLNYKVISAWTNPSVSQIEWLGVTHWKAGDLQGSSDPDEGPRVAEAKEWLSDYLKDGRLIQAKVVRKDAEADGHSWRTIERAKKILGVKSMKDGAGAWGWRSCPETKTATVKTASEESASRETTWRSGGLPKNTHNNNNIYVGGVHGGLQDRHGGLHDIQGEVMEDRHTATPPTHDEEGPPW